MIDIRPAINSHATFITANLRPLDHREAFCQLPPDTKATVLGLWLASQAHAHIAYVNDDPVMLFGASPINAYVWAVWALGTRHCRRAVPAVSRYFTRTLIPQLIDEHGIIALEARSYIENVEACRWIENLGGEQCGEPFPYGREHERFALYRWTVAAYRTIDAKNWSKSQ
jgi:hypothetical protein